MTEDQPWTCVVCQRKKKKRGQNHRIGTKSRSPRLSILIFGQLSDTDTNAAQVAKGEDISKKTKRRRKEKGEKENWWK